MTYSLEEIKKLRAKAEASLYKTSQLQQMLGQIEVSLLRKENQKVIKKFQNKSKFLCQEVSNYELLFTSVKKHL